jgi:Transposase
MKEKALKGKKGSGRPSLVNKSDLEIIREIHKKNPKISAPKLNNIFREKTNCTISDETMRKNLVYLGFGAFYIAKKPLLSKRNKNLRIEICTKWSFKPDSFWDEVIFSDECKFNLFNSDGRIKVWRERGKRLDPKYINSTVKHGNGGVTAWGSFSSKGVGILVFINGIMDKYVYCNILANNLVESASIMGLKNFTFQHDNDPKHSSKIVRRFLEESEIPVLEWAS